MKQHKNKPNLRNAILLLLVSFLACAPTFGQEYEDQCTASHYALKADDPVPIAMQTLRIIAKQGKEKALSEAVLEGEMILYPNPTNNVLKALLPTQVAQVAGVKMFDMVGKEYPVFITEATTRAYRINVNTLSAGVYLLKLYLNDGTIHKQRFSKF